MAGMRLAHLAGVLRVALVVTLAGLASCSSKPGPVVDIAPTILALRGVPVGRDMDGEILEGILKPGVLEALDPRSVASHDTPEWLASRGSGDVARPGEDERLEQLRALGYLGEDGESVE